jgi:ABC-type branched-subunit amino acid transport system permease subunit
VREMLGLKVTLGVMVGILVGGFLGIAVIYPLIKTLEGWFTAVKALALGEVPVELGLTAADGGEKVEE